MILVIDTKTGEGRMLKHDDLSVKDLEVLDRVFIKCLTELEKKIEKELKDTFVHKKIPHNK